MINHPVVLDTVLKTNNHSYKMTGFAKYAYSYEENIVLETNNHSYKMTGFAKYAYSYEENNFCNRTSCL